VRERADTLVYLLFILILLALLQVDDMGVEGADRVSENDQVVNIADYASSGLESSAKPS
jgi:hypothetical protein